MFKNGVRDLNKLIIRSTLISLAMLFLLSCENQTPFDFNDKVSAYPVQRWEGKIDKEKVILDRSKGHQEFELITTGFTVIGGKIIYNIPEGTKKIIAFDHLGTEIRGKESLAFSPEVLAQAGPQVQKLLGQGRKINLTTTRDRNLVNTFCTERLSAGQDIKTLSEESMALINNVRSQIEKLL